MRHPAPLDPPLPSSSRAAQALALLAAFALLAARPATGLAQDAQPSAEASADAAGAEDPRLAEARRLYDEGEAHFQARRFVLAAQTFERTYALMEEAGHPNRAMVLYNMARSLDEVAGRERDARTAYQRFLEEGDTQNPTIQQALSTVQARIRELDARIATAEASEPPAHEGPAEPPPDEGPGFWVGGIGVAAAGAALMIGGAITGGLTLAGADEVNARCDVPATRCPPEVEDRAREVQTLAGVTDALLIGGGAIALAGIILMFVVPTDEAPSDPESPQVEASAYCGPAGCGALLGGRF